MLGGRTSRGGGRASLRVVTRQGEEYHAPLVISTADPARTMLQLVDPVWLDPELLLAVRNIKFRGSAQPGDLCARGAAGAAECSS